MRAFSFALTRESEMYGIKVYMRGQPPEWFMVNPDRDSYRRPARFSTIDDAFEASLSPCFGMGYFFVCNPSFPMAIAHAT
jgi:hypothetical protein